MSIEMHVPRIHAAWQALLMAAAVVALVAGSGVMLMMTISQLRAAAAM